MHIVFICAEFPIHGRPTGGFGRYVENLSSALRQHGHSVSIICSGIHNERLTQKKITIYSIAKSKILDLLGRKFPFIPVSFIQYPLFFSWKVAQCIKSLHQIQKIDIIEAGDFGAEAFFYLFLYRYLQIPLVIKLHTTAEIIRRTNGEPLSLFYRCINFFEGYCLQHASSIYAPTEAIMKLSQKIYGITISAVIPYIFNARSTSVLKVQRNWQQLLYVGKLQTKKGIYILIDTFHLLRQKYPNLKLRLIGPNTFENGRSNKEKIQALSKQYNLAHSLIIDEPKKGQKLAKYYLESGGLIVPSLWENFPNVILEAARYKCPVIAFKSGGIKEMIENNKTGLLCTGKSLGTQIVRLCQNHELAKQLANNCYADFSQRYNEHLIVQKTINYYQLVLSLPS